MDESKKEHLRTLWELFRNSPDGSYERSSRLNVLLAECLILHKNGVDIKELVTNFTLVSSITTIICCELLSDVHRMIQNIRSASADNAEPSPEEPVIPSVNFKRENSALARELFESFTDKQLLLQKNTLKNSILKGTAWRILAVIQRLGPEALSCKRQLCGFLIWLCEGLSGEGSDCLQFNHHLMPPDKRGPMYDLFKNKIWIKERNKNNKRDVDNRKRHNKRVLIDRPGPSAQNQYFSSDSDNDRELGNLGNIAAARIPMNPGGNHSPQSPKSPPWQKIEHREPVENFMTDQHKEIMNSEISLFELHLIAVDVLYKLCKHDVIFAELPPDLAVSFQAANFAFKQLHALEFENPPILQCRLDPTNIFKLKSALTELLIVSMDRTIARNGSNFSYLKTYGIPILLKLLNRMIKNIKVLTYLNEQEKLYSSKYLFGVNYVILIMVYFSLTRKCNLNIDELLRNNELFGEIQDGLVFGYSINLIMKISGNNSEIVEYVKKLLILIMRLITLMKRVRAISEHSRTCTLESHKRCRAGLLKLMNHHSPDFGRHFFDSEVEDDICRVTKFFHVFTYLMTNEYFIRNAKLRVKILKCMKSCGACCCFPPEHLMENCIKLINLHNNIAKPCFDVLEYVLYNQIGFIKLDLSRQVQCDQCEKTYKKASVVTTIGLPESKNCTYVYTWPYLKYYTDLLQSDDSALLHATMSHILQVSLIYNINLKRDLLFNVLYSSFETAKRHYLATKSENSFFIALSCLRLITNLVCSVSTAEEFINSGKLKGVLQLVHLSEFSKACCSLLEISIDVEIFNIQCEFYTNIYNGNLTTTAIVTNIRKLPSMNLLIVCLKKVTDKLFTIFEQQLDNNDLFSKLTTLKSDAITFSVANSELDPLPEMSIAANIVGDRIEILKNALNYWKTCASLCLYCPILRKYFASQLIFKESYKLLKLILYGIYNIKYSEVESRLLIKLSESLIIFGLCLSESTMNDSKDFMVQLLREALLSDINEIDELNMKLLLEMLIRVSSVYINKVQVLPDVVKKKLPVFTFPHPDAELYASSEDEDESKYVCPYLKEDSDQYVTADEGYEADIEICPADGSVHHKTQNFSDANNKDVSDVTKLMKMGGIIHDSREVLHTRDVKKNFLVHGEISNVLIDVLMKLIKIIMLKSFRCDVFDEPTIALKKLVCKCINRLTSIFSIEDNCTIVNDLISRILSNPVAKILKLESTRLEELQRSLLSLIYSIANHCIKPMELKLYLEIFTFTNIPMHILLEPLGKLADEIVCNVPDFIVCFPTKKLSEAENTQLNISIPGETPPLDLTPDSFEKAHISAGIASCWSSTSLWCPIEKIESIWANGYSVCMWIRLQEFQDSPAMPSDLFQFSSADESDDENIPEWKYKRNKYFKTKFHNHQKFHKNRKNLQPDYVPDILHLFSFGQDNIITEFWVNANNGDLHIKNCVPQLDSNRVVGDEIIPRLLPLRRWFHFAINVKEIILKQNFGFEISLFVNSVQMSTAIISLEGAIHKKRRPTYLLLGHSTSKYNENIKFAGSWCVSEMSIYRSPVLNQNNILYMMAHGPNKLSFQVCQADKITLDFSPVFSNNLITSKINWDKIIEMSDEDVEDLQNNLLVKFSASNPYHLEAHHQSKVRLKGLRGKIPRVNAVAGTIPSSVMCTWVGSALHNQYRGLPVAVYLLGGPQILLYLFARVVELGGHEEEQACALRILLKISFSDMRLYSAFHKDDILSLVLAVFSSQKCFMSFHLLEAMLGASVDDPVLVNVNSRFHLLTKNYPTILHPEIIVSLVKAWKDLERNYHVESKKYTLSTKAKMTDTENKSIWVKSRLYAPKNTEAKDIIVDGNKTLLETLLLFLKLLVRDDHPGRVFNIYQLNKVNMVDNLLMSCKERFLNSDFDVLNERAIKDLVDVIRSLIGSPPDYRSISCVTDFLTLMHQANLTFVTHSRSSFYFLLSPDLYEPEKKTSNILSLPFMGRKRSKRGSKRKRHGHMISDNGIQQVQRISTEEQNTLVDQEISLNETVPTLENITIDENAHTKKDLALPVHSPQEYSFSQEYTSIRDTSAQPLNEDSSFEHPPTSQISFLAQPSTSKEGAVSLEMSQVSTTTVDTVTMQENVSIRETSPIRHFNRLKQSTVVKYKRGDPSKLYNTEKLNQENPKSVASYDTYELTKDFVVVESSEGTPLLTVPTTIKEQLRYIFRSPILRPGCKSSWVICEGLLMLLKDTISIMPDNQLHQVLGKVFNHNILLVLSNHQELYVRIGVVRVVAALVQRYFPEDMKKLTNTNYFVHLANQLSLYQASIDLVVACASLIFGNEISLDNIISALDYVKDDALMRCPPLLALLSCTFHNISLFRNVVRIIRKIIEKGSIKLLSDVGICEAVLKSLKFLGTNGKNSVADFDIILKGCQVILGDVSKKILSQNMNNQLLIDLYNQLMYFELNEKQPFSDQTIEICSVMRETSSFIFIIEIDFIIDKLQLLENNRDGLDSSSREGTETEVSSQTAYEIFHVLGVKFSETPLKLGFRATRSDLLARQFATLMKVCSFVTYRDFSIEASFTEHQLVMKVFSIIMPDVYVTNHHHGASNWLHPNKDYLRNVFIKFFYWIIAPGSLKVEMQKEILSRVCEEPGLKLILTPNDPLKQKKLSLYLSILAANINEQNGDCNNLLDLIMDWVLAMELAGDIIITDEVVNEAKRLRDLDKEEARKSINFSTIERSAFVKNSMAVSLVESAMAVTRTVVEIQNFERKQFLKHLRRQQNILVSATQKWRDIVDKYCHEKGAWYCQEAYPNSWELNPTEGPDRIRIRLRRCNLDIDERFFNEQKREKRRFLGISKPLEYLFDSLHSCVQGGLIERLHMNENICFMSRAKYVTVKHEQDGELLLSDRCIHFLPDTGDDHQSITGAYWPLIDIVSVSTRRWQLRERAVEVFLSSGHAHLIAFASFSEMKAFLNSLDSCHLPNRVPSDPLLDIINQWRNGNLSNWAYLMKLNCKAGRTYNDLMQYPVFPFILSDYTSLILDLTDPKSYRNLHKPMAIQNKENEAHYIRNYNYLKEARNESGGLSRFNQEPYHYGSHYSNSGTVLHFMVRLSPFTQLFLNYQDNNFDIPDRTFHSLQTTWRLSSRDSNTDVKELIPEFFYLSEMLCNNEDLAFGVRQNGVQVDNVELPPWSKNARLLVLIHRQALESAFVKENLPNWIDLVFGYKQTGQPAIDAVNVFHPATYYGFDSSVIKDKLEKTAWETMVRTYGQTPRQLLKQPHPQYITNFQHVPNNVIRVLPYVKGLRWGSYCGSPEEPQPSIAWRRHNRVVPLQGVISLKTNEVFGVAGGSTIIPLFEKKDNVWKVPVVNLILWGYPDGIIRIKYRDEPPKPLIKIPDLDPLCAVSQGFGETSSTLWLGLQSGRIIVLIASAFNTVIPSITFSRKPINLYGHNSPIVDISVCVSFGVTASASEDGVVNIWDLHNFTFIRTIDNKMPTVSKVCISQTLGDVATVHLLSYDKNDKSDLDQQKLIENRNELGEAYDPRASSSDNQNTSSDEKKPKKQSITKYSSKLFVRTINGVLVGQVKVAEKICSLCYSNAPEGISVNVIAAGLETGAIRLFSSWDLKPLIVMTPNVPTYPIISMAYSENSQHLYVCASDGAIILWEIQNNRQDKSAFRVFSPKNLLMIPS